MNMQPSVLELGCINILQPQTTIANINLLKDYVSKKYSNEDISDTWTCLCMLINQDLLKVKRSDCPEIVWFNSGNTDFKVALNDLMGNFEIPEDVEYDFEERKYFENQFHAAFDIIVDNFPETYVAFKDLISFIVVGRRKGYGGGTTSNRIGLIWLSPDKSWSILNWVENILHEYIHNVIFLDDMVNSIFLVNTKKLAEPDSLATSAIRKEKRGYDKAYHSAFVSYGIINHYLHMKQDAKAVEFIDSLLICISDIILKKHLISNHGLQNLYDLANDTLKIRSFLMKTES